MKGIEICLEANVRDAQLSLQLASSPLRELTDIDFGPRSSLLPYFADLPDCFRYLFEICAWAKSAVRLPYLAEDIFHSLEERQLPPLSGALHMEFGCLHGGTTSKAPVVMGRLCKLLEIHFR